MSRSSQLLGQIRHLRQDSVPEDRTEEFLQELHEKLSGLLQEKGKGKMPPWSKEITSSPLNPIEASDLFLKQLKSKLKGWKISDWDFFSRKAGTLAIELTAISPDKVQRRPRVDIAPKGDKYVASFYLGGKGIGLSAKGSKGSKTTVTGSSVKDLMTKLSTALGKALSALKEDKDDPISDTLEELLGYCTEVGIELESDALEDLVTELEEWVSNSDLTEAETSKLGGILDRLKGMIAKVLGGIAAKNLQPAAAAESGKTRGLAEDLRELLVESSKIGSTIWKQLHMSTKMSVGARKPALLKRGITFQVHSKPMRYIEITLSYLDLYDIKYYRLKRGSYKEIVISEKTMIGVENLNSVVYSLVNK